MTGETRLALQRALLVGFNPEGLRELLRYKLDVNPDEVLPHGNQREQVEALITWADQNGRIDALLDKIVESRPQHHEVLRIVDSVRTGHADGSAAPDHGARVEVELTHDGALWWGDKRVIVTAGRQSRVASGRIANEDDREHVFEMLVAGVDSRWVEIKPPVVNVEARTESTFEVFVSPPAKIVGRRRKLSLRAVCGDCGMTSVIVDLNVVLLAPEDVWSWVGYLVLGSVIGGAFWLLFLS